MEHCSYRHSDFYQLISLSMHCMEAQLSNKPKQSILTALNFFSSNYNFTTTLPVVLV